MFAIAICFRRREKNLPRSAGYSRNRVSRFLSAGVPRYLPQLLLLASRAIALQFKMPTLLSNISSPCRVSFSRGRVRLHPFQVRLSRAGIGGSIRVGRCAVLRSLGRLAPIRISPLPRHRGLGNGSSPYAPLCHRHTAGGGWSAWCGNASSPPPPSPFFFPFGGHYRNDRYVECGVRSSMCRAAPTTLSLPNVSQDPLMLSAIPFVRGFRRSMIFCIPCVGGSSHVEAAHLPSRFSGYPGVGYAVFDSRRKPVIPSRIRTRPVAVEVASAPGLRCRDGGALDYAWLSSSKTSSPDECGTLLGSS